MRRPDRVGDEASSHHVITGLVPVIPIGGRSAFRIEMAGDKPGHAL
jgi:hypothetical protein